MKGAEAVDRAHLARFKDLVQKTCGFHLENEREATLRAALRQRMSALGVETVDAYFNALQADTAEFDRLVAQLTVNETYFMREPGHLRLLVQQLVPELLALREGPLRLLCAGCSSGEEPYSIAMLLRELHGDACERLFSLTGVDLDAAAITAARKATYGRNSFRGMDPELVIRHFDAVGNGAYRVCDATRRLVSFETVNLLSAAYPPLMQHQDIILYRNVSIYFARQVQKDVFAHLAGMLNEDGYLIVGAAETMHHDLGVLSLMERDGLYIFRKQAVSTPRSVPEIRRPLRQEPVVLPVPLTLSAPAVADGSARRELVSARASAQIFEEALVQARAKQWDDSMHTLDALIAQDPAFLKAFSLKASLLMTHARYAEAQELCEQVIARDALCLDACLMLGVIARRDGDDALAYRRFREALYLDADNWLAHYYLAEILSRKGDVKRSRAGYESALRVLENEALLKKSQSLFPLSFNARQFIAICRHKLSLPKESA